MFVINQIHTSWDSYQIVQCRDGEFKNNVIYFGRTEGFPYNRSVWVQNPQTQPETFVFANNLWYCIADPSNSMPDWQTLEGLYGCPQHSDNITGDPLFLSSAPELPVDFFLRAQSPARGMGLVLNDIDRDFFDRYYAVPNRSIGAFEITENNAPPMAPRSPAIIFVK